LRDNAVGSSEIVRIGSSNGSRFEVAPELIARQTTRIDEVDDSERKDNARTKNHENSCGQGALPILWEDVFTYSNVFIYNNMDK
jgi:hypothetical protein